MPSRDSTPERSAAGAGSDDARRRLLWAALLAFGGIVAAVLALLAWLRIEPLVILEIRLEAVDLELDVAAPAGEDLDRAVLDEALVVDRVAWSGFGLAGPAPGCPVVGGADATSWLAMDAACPKLQVLPGLDGGPDDGAAPAAEAACGLSPDLRHAGPLSLRVVHDGPGRFGLEFPEAGSTRVWSRIEPLDRVRWEIEELALPDGWCARVRDAGPVFRLDEAASFELAGFRIEPLAAGARVHLTRSEPPLEMLRVAPPRDRILQVAVPEDARAVVDGGEALLLWKRPTPPASILNTGDLPMLSSLQLWDPMARSSHPRSWVLGGRIVFPQGDRPDLELRPRAFVSLEPASLALRSLVAGDDGLTLVAEGTVRALSAGSNWQHAHDLRPSRLQHLYALAEWRWFLPGVGALVLTVLSAWLQAEFGRGAGGSSGAAGAERSGTVAAPGAGARAPVPDSDGVEPDSAPEA